MTGAVRERRHSRARSLTCRGGREGGRGEGGREGSRREGEGGRGREGSGREGEGGRQLEEGRPRERERKEGRKEERERRDEREGSLITTCKYSSNTVLYSTMEIQKWIHTVHGQ